MVRRRRAARLRDLRAADADPTLLDASAQEGDRRLDFITGCSLEERRKQVDLFQPA